MSDDKSLEQALKESKLIVQLYDSTDDAVREFYNTIGCFAKGHHIVSVSRERLMIESDYGFIACFVTKAEYPTWCIGRKYWYEKSLWRSGEFIHRFQDDTEEKYELRGGQLE